MSEQDQPQGGQTPLEQAGQEESLEQVSARIGQLEAKIADGDTKLKEKDSLITKLQQETATYQKILTDRNQQQRQPAQPVSNLETKINDLKRRAQRGEIDAEELQSATLDLIAEAKNEGHQSAVNQLTSAYEQEKAIGKSMQDIFSGELKGMDQVWGDVAIGYMQAAIAQGYSMQQATNYAKEQTLSKYESAKSRFVKPSEPPKEEKNQGASGFKAEGDSPKKLPEKPVSSEESGLNFIDARRKQLAARRGYSTT